MGKHRAVLLLAALLATSLMGLGEAQGSASIGVRGFVYGPNGEPLQNASIRLWGFYLEAETTTDSTGHYELSATTTQGFCQLYAFYDDPDTDGYDLLPSQRRLDTGEDTTLSVNFTLQPAATVRVTGQLKPVESTRKVTKYAFEVVDALEGRVIELGEYRLTYGTDMNVQSYFLDLDTMTLIVPADTPFWVEVSSSYQHERYPPSRYRRYRWGSGRTRIETFNEFSMAEGEAFILGAGEVLELDIRKYSLTADMARIHPMVEEVEVDLSEVEGQGFYVAAESHGIQEAKEFLSGIDEKIESQEYEGAYVDLRQAYLKLLSVRGRLEAAVYEAGVSLKILMVFTAVTSVALGALLAANGLLKLLLTLGSFGSMILYLRQVFPGSAVIEPGSFTSMAAASLLGALLVLSLLPRVLGDAVGEGGMARVGALVAVFSMGSRSLRRRKLRSLFTFATILTLTMSFVALTSFSTSYGLIFNRYGGDKPDAEGIMVRMPYYPPNSEFEKGVFSPIIDVTIEWAWGNEGVVNVAELAENIPSLRPYGRIGEWPIFGVIGVQPDVEPLMSLIDDAVVEGGPLREEGDCLLHRYMRNNARLEVGDQIVIKGVPLRIVGFFGRVKRIADV
ncbi:carboxypeptidase regulatory-like domain-containing protein, partial [Candidatus Bathyarchaeota archaeon]